VTAPAPTPTTITRFSRAERWLHWATAAAVLTCAITGFVLYVGPLTALVGRRTLVKDVHVVAGLAMPVPLLAAYAGRWRAAVRADIRRLGRWSRSDKRWLWSRGRDATDAVGKFNAGQKANAAFVAGMIPTMVVTGVVMRWYEPFDIRYRTGATFVHDWTAIATWVIVAGHIVMALTDPGSLRGMLTGRVTRRWAEDRHPRWAAEMPGGRGRDPDGSGGSGSEGGGDAADAAGSAAAVRAREAARRRGGTSAYGSGVGIPADRPLR
jgi:formate dehydrogenase subunit gamma